MGQIAPPPLTLRQMVDGLDYELELAELTAAKYPRTHPVQTALRSARDTRDDLAQQIPWYSTGSGDPFAGGSPQYASYRLAIDALLTAQAQPSDAVIPETIWHRARQLPWAWITVGAAGLLGVGLFVRGGRR